MFSKLDSPITAIILLTLLVLAFAHLGHWAVNKAGGGGSGLSKFFTLTEGEK